MVKRKLATDNERLQWRSLRMEILEERRVLSAAASIEAAPLVEGSPWQNPVYPLDVSGDGVVVTSDMLVIINRILTDGMGKLDPPSAPVTSFYDTDGNNRLNSSDLLLIVNALLTRPEVETSTLASFTVDVTPQVTVKVQSDQTGTLPDGTVVFLDVDLNNDGDFIDAGESGQTQSTLYQGQSVFTLTTALPRSDELYSVRLQARVKDTRAVFGTSPAIPLVVDTQTSDALANYVNTPDPSYSYTKRNGDDGETRSIPFVGSYTYYAIDMTSQTWRSTEDVDQPVWRHWLTIYVPNTPVVTSSAVLLIDGGSNGNFNDVPGAIDLLGQASILLRTPFIHLKVVPNEPVTFTDETQSRSEDEIIAYSFDKFLDNVGEPGNETWPVLVAMVKSAVRAMDTAQAIVPTIDDFVVTGYSKRGWTTWLTAAVDDRVRAILPGVFDNLNQGPQMVHHYGAYGFFSQAVQPYNDMQIFDRILTPEALPLSHIVDPYTYLANGRFDNMPKLLINSAGDEFFASDSAQFYFDDIPGNENYLIYLPNTGHGLDLDLNDPSPQQSKVASATITFVDAVLNNRTLPKYSWTVGQDGAIRVETDTQPLEVKLWQATNPNARDFRHAYNPTITWTSTDLSASEPGVYIGNVPMPDSGATAYLVELTFPSTYSSPIPVPYLSDPYIFTTEVRVKSPQPLYDWPFDSAFDTLSLGDALSVAGGSTAQSAAADPSLNAVASALAIKAGAIQEETRTATPFSSLAATDTAITATYDDPAVMLLEDQAIPATLATSTGNTGSVELALEELLPELLA
jgi:PhoPQ-activated pathogenicity-related protein